MSFSPVIYEDKTIGYSMQNGDALYFFGTEFSNYENIKARFDKLHFMNIKQVHGDAIIESPLATADQRPVADAHWTAMSNVALVIQTADCLPVLISHNRFVCAIHAGWRGVKNEIAKKSIELLKRIFKLSPLEYATVEVVWGPHIQAQSFEVDFVLAQEFEKQYRQLSGKNEVLLPHRNLKNKAYVNLSEVLHAQMLACGLVQQQLHQFSADTFTDRRFASFRRQKESAGRNLSFVARLS